MSNAADTKPAAAIIGAGYAGMAAAVKLTEAGVRAVVFEAGQTLGGRARRIDYRGETLDNGQHILAGAYTDLLRLMRLVGVPDSAFRRVPLRLSMPPEFLLAAPRAAALPRTLYLAWTLMSAKGLSIVDKFAAVRFMRALKRTEFRVDPSESVAQLLSKHKQPQNLIDYLWQPLTISALNTPLARASAQVFANVLRDSLGSTREASDLLLPCTDLTALFPEPAAAWIAQRGSEVRVGDRVKQVVAEDGRYLVTSRTGVQQFDGVIFAVGPHQLEGLMPHIPVPALTFEPIVTVYFKFDRPIRMGEPMSGKIHGIAQWFFDRRLLNDCAAPSHNGDGGLFAAVISASGPHERLSQEDLADAVLIELAKRIPDLPKPIWHKVVTEKFATFACTSTADRPVTTTRYPGVFRAGDYVAGDYPATLEGAVRNGLSAAKALGVYLAIRNEESDG